MRRFTRRSSPSSWAKSTASRPTTIRPHLYEHADADAVRHLFRVAASLDSVVIGEGQIAGQVKEAFELAQKAGATGPLLNALFPPACASRSACAPRPASPQGHVSVSSAAVDFVRAGVRHFTDKTVLVIGAGKMGRLTLKHLQELNPARILVTNRSPEKAAATGGRVRRAGGAVGATRRRAGAGRHRAEHDRRAGADRDAAAVRREGACRGAPAGRWWSSTSPCRATSTRGIHDGDRVCVFNVDDLTRVAEQAAAERRKHVPAAEAIVDAEVAKFVQDWNRRKDGPVIGQLTAEVDRVREAVLEPLLAKLNGKLTDAEKAYDRGRVPAVPEPPAARPDRGAAGSQPRRPQRHAPRGADEAVRAEGLGPRRQFHSAFAYFSPRIAVHGSRSSAVHSPGSTRAAGVGREPLRE